jgi:hypothetical protein
MFRLFTLELSNDSGIPLDFYVGCDIPASNGIKVSAATFCGLLIHSKPRTNSSMVH